MENNNMVIRNVMKTTGLKQWQVADALGVSEWKFCRMLRHELPMEEQDKIVELMCKKMEEE